LPKFINDPRYVLLPSVAARREAFDEYCRDRARELRELSVKQDKQSSDPKTEFHRLLEQEVKSTRTSWSEFRRTWKKDRRFYGWGRDDREREKQFREFLKELGESKCLSYPILRTILFMADREACCRAESRSRLFPFINGAQSGNKRGHYMERGTPSHNAFKASIHLVID
jgi:hypothetical protein